jgi:hypothetical protein
MLFTGHITVPTSCQDNRINVPGDIANKLQQAISWLLSLLVVITWFVYLKYNSIWTYIDLFFLSNCLQTITVTNVLTNIISCWGAGGHRRAQSSGNLASVVRRLNELCAVLYCVWEMGLLISHSVPTTPMDTRIVLHGLCLLHKTQKVNNTTQYNTTRHDTTQYNTTRHYTTIHNTTRHNTTRHDKTQHNTTRHGTTRHDTTKHNTTLHDTTQHDTTQHNMPRHNTTRHDTTRQYTTQHDTTRHSTTQQDTARHSTTQQDTTQHDTTGHGTTQHDTTWHNTTQDTTQHNTTQHNTTRHDTSYHLFVHSVVVFASDVVFRRYRVWI